MPENEEEIHMNMNMNVNNSPKLRELDSMDLDVDGTWNFDQILSDPLMLSSSPFFMAADQPFSPPWAFPDDTDEKPGENATLTPSECTEHVSGNPDATIETPSKNEEMKKQMLPVFELTPSVYPDGTCVIKEKMTLALRYFKEWSEQHVLAQIWAPVKNGGRFVLTTSGQPFILDPNSIGLYQYRMVSLMYMFSLDGDTDEALGLPGRVFRQKLPEWTPNVQYYSDKEYPRLTHALNYNVRGSLALPVFEPTGKSCVGVLELIMTSQKINYAPEVDKVCKALEAVNLKSSDILEHTNTQICNESRQNALAEILEILTVVCETHKFPLAQTWIPCRHRSVITYGGGLRKNCSSFDGSCMGQVCMSTTDVAFYVVDAHMWGFREACAEHHLQKGQGVAGRAFSSRGSCFCENITRFCKTEYPLVHYARMFGLVSSFAVCLRSSHTGEDDYILEFFLPPNMVESSDQQLMLRSLLMTMKQHFRSLKVASGEEIEEDGKSVEIIKASTDTHKLDSMIESIRLSESIPSPPDPLPYGGQVVHLDSLGEPLQRVESDALNSIVQNVGNSAVQSGFPSSENKLTGKKSDRKRGKAEKSISLEVLQQHFAGSLKDAAKSLGVCPTTMKRICRQHGISRWPSRKINKVNRSLTKLKSVIESVQGAEGRFTMASLATTSLPVVDSVPWPAVTMPNPNEHDRQNLSSPKSSELQKQKNEPSNHQSSGSEAHAKTESIGTPTSHGSCQGSPNLEIESAQNHQNVSPHKEAGVELAPFYRLENQSMKDLDLAAAFSIPDVLLTPQPDEQFGGMLIEDSGSSHDLRNLCSNILSQNQNTLHFADAGPQEFAGSVHEEVKHFPSRPEPNTITIKATYKEDIIRFRLGLGSGIVALKEEAGKRLKLEIGTFDIKYLDDDHEWVMIACDADLQECVDISRSSGSSTIRLLVHDLSTVFGSSCESSGEL